MSKITRFPKRDQTAMLSIRLPRSFVRALRDYVTETNLLRESEGKDKLTQSLVLAIPALNEIPRLQQLYLEYERESK